MKQQFKVDRLSIADKWDMASKIWHSNREVKIIETLMKRLKIPKSSLILDVACGTGFHSLNLCKLGYNVIASDNDENNLAIFSNNLSECQSFNIRLLLMDWLNMNSTLISKGDALMCLGSSITYFESWKEGKTINNENRIRGLKRVLNNFKNRVHKDGKVIIGFSRHYPRSKDLEIVDFQSKNIGGEIVKMKWFLKLDWKNHHKIWTCDVRSQKSDYTFELESHLYSLKEFRTICLTIFNKVEVVDIDSSYYDLFVVCS